MCVLTVLAQKITWFSNQALLDRLFSSRASGARAQTKRTSDQRVNEKLNRQGFKTHANNVLLWLWISAVFRECNSTAELTLNGCGVVQYIQTAAPELQLKECALLHYTTIFLQKQIVETFFAVIRVRLAENCRGRTTTIICTRTNAPKYILESHRLHFGSICDQNGRNFEPCIRRLQRTVRTAERIIGVHLPSLQDLYYSRVKKRAGNIITDPSPRTRPVCASPFRQTPYYRSLCTRTSKHKIIPVFAELLPAFLNSLHIASLSSTM